MPWPSCSKWPLSQTHTNTDISTQGAAVHPSQPVLQDNRRPPPQQQLPQPQASTTSKPIPKPKPYRILKPPPAPFLPPNEPTKGKKPQAPIPLQSSKLAPISARRSTTPILPPHRPSTPTSKPLRKHHAPDLTTALAAASSSKGPQVSLHSLKAPALPGPPKPGPATMKTISTTRLAQATDPFSDKGALGLLSIFTKAENKERMDPVEKELKRGLFQSPEKTAKTKGKAFIRYVHYHINHNAIVTMSTRDIGEDSRIQQPNFSPVQAPRNLSGNLISLNIPSHCRLPSINPSSPT